MVADQPVPPSLLGELLERSGEQVEDLCTELATEYDVTGRGFVLVRVAGGYRFQSSPDLLAGVTPDALRAAFLRAVAPRPVPTVDVSHLHVTAASVGEAMEELLEELPRAGRITFHRLTGGLVDRLEVVVRFLALLELFKQGLVELDQAGSFAELVVVWVDEHADDRAGGAALAMASVDAYDG